MTRFCKWVLNDVHRNLFLQLDILVVMFIRLLRLMTINHHPNSTRYSTLNHSLYGRISRALVRICSITTDYINSSYSSSKKTSISNQRHCIKPSLQKPLEQTKILQTILNKKPTEKQKTDTYQPTLAWHQERAKQTQKCTFDRGLPQIACKKMCWPLESSFASMCRINCLRSWQHLPLDRL